MASAPLSTAGFTTSIHCMDGRIQEKLIAYIREDARSAYVDCITEAGPCRFWDPELKPELAESLVEKVNISVNHHGSRRLYLSGHEDCHAARYPREKQIAEIQHGATLWQKRFPQVEVILLWIPLHEPIEQVALVAAETTP